MNWKKRTQRMRLAPMLINSIERFKNGVILLKSNQDLQKRNLNWRLAALSVYVSAAFATGKCHSKTKKLLRFLVEEWLGDYKKSIIDEWFGKNEQSVLAVEDCAIFLSNLPEPILDFIILNLFSVLYSDGPIDNCGQQWLLTLIQHSGIKLDLWIFPWRFFERGDIAEMRKTALSILGLSEGFNSEELKIANRQASLGCCPAAAQKLDSTAWKLAEEQLKEINWAYEYLQSWKKHSDLFVILANREIRRLESASGRETVHCILCDTQNRLPDQKQHSSCRCEMCHALLTFSEEIINGLRT